MATRVVRGDSRREQRRAVARVLLTKSADQAATDLFELFGEAAIEQIQKLLERRWELPLCDCLYRSRCLQF